MEDLDQQRRAVLIDDAADELPPRTGVDGFKRFSSTGAAGSLAPCRAGRAAARRTSSIC
jgi:hypothetical protein